ncbi:major facilitator superfamily transporter [Apiospora rasikravindrae]|uniref:Major facilitator superfamily transporter n=1 Tax=Apiospora rasikravindrae TaxID=990691 RepID=A0ABR1RQ34_9PEZI
MPQLKERDPYAFPTRQLTVLAICRFSEPIAFNSILAYTYEMVKDLDGAGDARDAPFYAGLLVSAYAVAEALTAMGWGALSDRVGRKPVVLVGLGGVALSSLLFGLSTKYWVALLARFVGGALNGNVAVMQTMVAEMVKVPEHEPKAYATQPFVWTLGGIIGSAMGGFLAQPARFYPDLFPADGLFGRYPYLLPNLVAVVVVVLAIVQGIFFLEETNPRSAREAAAAADLADEYQQRDGGDTAVVDDDADENTPLTGAASSAPNRGRFGSNNGDSEATAARRRSSIMSTSLSRPQFIEEGLPVPVQPNFDLRRSSFGTVHAIRVGHGSTTTAATDAMAEVREQHAARYGNSETTSGTATPTSSSKKEKPKAFNFTIIMLTIALVLVSYHQMAFVTLLPTHLLDDPTPGFAGGGRLDLHGGLGYTVHDVGVYLSVNGVLGLLIQGLVFPPFVDKVGVWRSFVSMVVLYPLAYIVMPFVSVFPSGSSQQSAFVYLALVLQSFFGIIVIPCALILLKDATPTPRVLGRVNGLAMSGCCLARTVSPPLVGVIYAAGGSAAAWFSCAGFALLGIIQLAWVPRSRSARDLVAVVESEVENGDGNGIAPPLVKVDSVDSVTRQLREEQEQDRHSIDSVTRQLQEEHDQYNGR